MCIRHQNHERILGSVIIRCILPRESGLWGVSSLLRLLSSVVLEEAIHRGRARKGLSEDGRTGSNHLGSTTLQGRVLFLFIHSASMMCGHNACTSLRTTRSLGKSARSFTFDVSTCGCSGRRSGHVHKTHHTHTQNHQNTNTQNINTHTQNHKNTNTHTHKTTTTQTHTQAHYILQACLETWVYF